MTAEFISDPGAGPQENEGDRALPPRGSCQQLNDVSFPAAGSITFVLIPPGKFLMGSPKEEQTYITKTYFGSQRLNWLDDERQHEVTLTKPFSLDRTEVTQAQYRSLTGENPSHSKGDDLPVESVTWTEAAGRPTTTSRGPDTSSASVTYCSRCRVLLETATRGAVRFPRRVQALLRKALALRDLHAAGKLRDHGLAVARGRLAGELARACIRPRATPPTSGSPSTWGSTGTSS
jgi:hypothetical protein